MDMTEEEQLERMKQWWGQNGKSVLTAAALFVAIVVGWQYWQHHQAAQKALAADAFTEMTLLLNEGDTDSFEQLAESFLQSQSDSTYAGFTHLLLAKQAVEDKALEDAVAHLDNAISVARSPIADIARLRQARVLMELGRDADALVQLTHLEAPAFEVLAQELTGDIHRKAERLPDAIAAYQSAYDVASRRADAAFRLPFVKMKLNDLGVALKTNG